MIINSRWATGEPPAVCRSVALDDVISSQRETTPRWGAERQVAACWVDHSLLPVWSRQQLFVCFLVICLLKCPLFNHINKSDRGMSRAYTRFFFLEPRSCTIKKIIHTPFSNSLYNLKKIKQQKACGWRYLIIGKSIFVVRGSHWC